MTTLVNLHNEPAQIRIDRTSIFGNPFNFHKMGITREESVKIYKEWFYKKIQNESFRNQVLSLKDKKLGCWCVPELCHGHVILEYLEGIPIPWKNQKTPSISSGSILIEDEI